MASVADGSMGFVESEADTLQLTISAPELAGLQFDVEGVDLDTVEVVLPGWDVRVVRRASGFRVVAVYGGTPLPASSGRVIARITGAPGIVIVKNVMGSSPGPYPVGYQITGTTGTIPEPPVRGDVNGDRSADLLDFELAYEAVLVGDYILEADLAPFDAPNDTLDVVDLVLFADALTAGSWPDDSPVVSVAPDTSSTSFRIGSDGGIYGEATTVLLSANMTPVAGVKTIGRIVHEAEGLPQPFAYAYAGAERDRVQAVVAGRVVSAAIVTAVSNEPAYEDVQIVVGPNPAYGRFMIEGPRGADVFVYDVRGRLVHRAEQAHRQEIEGLSSGVYTVRISYQNKTWQSQVTVL
jgi:hypothetical protein